MFRPKKIHLVIPPESLQRESVNRLFFFTILYLFFVPDIPALKRFADIDVVGKQRPERVSSPGKYFPDRPNMTTTIECAGRHPRFLPAFSRYDGKFP
jgi:hypothetical protein